MKLPPPFSWLYAGWMTFSYILGIVMSTIILTILWIVGFGLYAVVLKMVRFMRKESPKETYWHIPPEEFEGRLKYQF